MNCSKPLASLGLAALLCACGGGDSSPSKTPAVRAVITVTAPALATTPRGGVPAQFSGGVCGGGNGQLTATWLYGDGSSSDHGNTHTYPVSGTSQSYPLIIQCTDTAGNPWATTTALIQVDP